MKEFEFKQLIGKIGLYCKITYEIDVFDDDSYQIDCDIYNKWFNAIQFSGNYFFEHFSKYKKRGFRLKIYEVYDMIIDTSNMVVFYTMIKLLSRETGYIIPGLTLDENGNLLIPK